METDVDYRIYPMTFNTVGIIAAERDEINVEPDYQRISNVWTKGKRQLLIDSLLNEFDIGKIYFHELTPPQRLDGRLVRYAIIDGKQRLEAIWAFIDGKLTLSDEIVYLRDPRVDLRGMTYSQIAQDYPSIKLRFDALPLPIVIIRTKDKELIEDMFLRLNDAVPLNAPEKRTAYPGPIPAAIRRIAEHEFFKTRLPFPDARYRHRDLSAKFIHIENSGAVVNTKKVDLDRMVLSFRDEPKDAVENSKSTVAALVDRVEVLLSQMNEVFDEPDPLLRQIGMVTLYFHVFRAARDGVCERPGRAYILEFDKRRNEYRRKAESSDAAESPQDLPWDEFEKHNQTPNDSYAIRIRLRLMFDDMVRQGLNVEEEKAQKLTGLTADAFRES